MTQQDESAPTTEDREVSSVKTVGGKEASGNDSSNKYGPAGTHDDYHGLAGVARYGPKELYTDKNFNSDEEESADEEEEEEDEDDIVDPKETLEQGEHEPPLAPRITMRRTSSGNSRQTLKRGMDGWEKDNRLTPQQSASSPMSAPASSTTTTSALSASPPPRTPARAPARTASRSSSTSCTAPPSALHQSSGPSSSKCFPPEVFSPEEFHVNRLEF